MKLIRKKHSRYWFARCYIFGKEVKFSTRETDYGLATSVAEAEVLRRTALAKNKLASRGSVVYFIQNTDTLKVKIGTSSNLDARLRALQSASGSKLQVLAAIRGGEPLEKAFHLRFASHRAQGEWFNWSPDFSRCLSEVLQTIALVQA